MIRLTSKTENEEEHHEMSEPSMLGSKSGNITIVNDTNGLSVALCMSLAFSFQSPDWGVWIRYH